MVLPGASMHMSKLSAKHQKVVVSEIARWQHDGTIDSDLALRLTAEYPLHSARPNVSQALSIVGAVLVGLGAILFMASNWQEIPVIAKLLAIFSVIGLSNFFGWKFRFEPGNCPKIGTALLLLGSLFYGGAIWLIAQIFNLDSNFPAGVLLWAVGTLGSALACSSMPLGCLAVILGGIWAFANFDWGRTEVWTFLPYFTSYLAAGLAVAFHLKSRAISWITLAFSSALMLVLVTGPLHNSALLLFGIAALAAFFLMREEHPLFEQPFLYTGSICTLGALLFGTFDKIRYDSPVPINDLSLLIFLCSTVLGVVAWRVPKFKEEVIVLGGLGLVSVLLLGGAPEYMRLGANITLLSAIGAFVYSGLMRVQSAGLVNVALVFFVIDIISRYFDIFYTLMNRSIFFVIGGVLLMAVGALTEKGRRTMMEGIQ